MFLIFCDKPVCEDKDPEYCEENVVLLGDRICEHDWFTSTEGEYSCKKTCNCCYNKPCTCDDRDGKHCENYVKYYGDMFCGYDWFISYLGSYGCKKSCGLCTPLEKWLIEYCF